MVYIKKRFEDMEIRLDVYEDEFFTQCPTCGKERQLDNEDLIGILKDGDFSGTTMFCNRDCYKNYTPPEE